MKKQIGLIAAAAMTAAVLGGCAGSTADTTLTMWVYPIGSFAEPELDKNDEPLTTSGAELLAAAFEEANPDINVEIVYKDFGGDDELAAAQAAGTAPDLILDSAERLLHSVQAGAQLADVSSCGWDDAKTGDAAQVSDKIVPACQDDGGVMRVYPVSLDINCMAINTSMFTAAGVGDIVGEDLAWTPEELRTALQAVADNGCYMPGMLIGGSISGDQGSRMLLQNVAGVPFTDEAHTSYTFGGESAIAALRWAKALSDDKLLCYGKTATAVDELRNFTTGNTAVSLCWSAANQALSANKDSSFQTLAVAFPSDGDPQLYGTVFGFALPENNGTVSQAAVRLVQFACEDATQAAETVRLTGALPVRASLSNAYADTEDEERMAQFTALLPYLGDLYGTTPNWGAQRTAWYNMLLTAFTGEGNEAPAETESEGEAAPEGEAQPTPQAAQPDDVTAAINNYTATVAG